MTAASTSADASAQEVSIDVTKLTALSHEVISKQATVRDMRVRVGKNRY